MSGNGNGRCDFETELAEMPSWKTEYDLWHPNRQSMSDRGAEETAATVIAIDAVPGRSTGQRRRGDGGRGAGRASSDLGGHRVGGGGADAGSRRPDGGDTVDGRMNRTEGWTHPRLMFPEKKVSSDLNPETASILDKSNHAYRVFRLIRFKSRFVSFISRISQSNRIF